MVIFESSRNQERVVVMPSHETHQKHGKRRGERKTKRAREKEKGVRLRARALPAVHTLMPDLRARQHRRPQVRARGVVSKYSMVADRDFNVL